MPVLIHATAEVEPGASVGEGTRIWRHVHVMRDAIIGRNCVLGQGCFVASGVRIGDGCRLQNNVSLYAGVELLDDVFVGPSAVFTNVSRPRVRNPRTPDQYEATRVGAGATIGANATIVCGHAIGACALVAAGAVVTRDVPAHALVMGVPARVRGWVCACGQPVSRQSSPPATLLCEACAKAPRSGPGGTKD